MLNMANRRMERAAWEARDPAGYEAQEARRKAHAERKKAGAAPAAPALGASGRCAGHGTPAAYPKMLALDGEHSSDPKAVTFGPVLLPSSPQGA